MIRKQKNQPKEPRIRNKFQQAADYFLMFGREAEQQIINHLDPENRVASISEIEKLLGKPESLVSGRVGTLYRAGVVKKERRADNRRLVDVHLHPEGRHLIAEVTRLRDELLAVLEAARVQ